MKKLLLYLTLLTLLIFILAGCFGKSSNNKNTSADEADFSAAKPQKVIESDPDVFTIRVFSNFKLITPIAYQFKQAVEAQYRKKYPKATIQWDEEVPSDLNRWQKPYFDTMYKSLTEKRAADVLFYSDDVSKLVRDGYLLDLSDQPWVANLRTNIKDTLSYNGKIYGGSMGMETVGIWYNKDTFSKLDLQVPRNWTDFIALCTKLKAAGITPLTVGLQRSVIAIDQYFMPTALTAETLSNPDFELNLHNGIGKVNGPEYQGVLKKFLELFQKGFLDDNPQKDWTYAIKDFLMGKAAMAIEWSFLPYEKDGGFNMKPTINIGFFPIPDDNGNSVLESWQYHRMFINSSSKLIRQSQDLVSIFMSKEVASIFAKEAGVFPVSKGVEVKYPQPEMNEALQWVNASPSANVSEFTRGYLPESTRTAIGDALINIVAGKPYTGRELETAQKLFDKDKGTVVLPE